MKQPRAYQLTGIERGRQENLLLADDRGLGKTLQAVYIACAVMRVIGSPNLVIVPKGLIPQWQAEIEEHDTEHHTIAYLTADTKLDRKYSSRKQFWLLTHYEAVVRHYKVLKLSYWSTIILDEAHRIKNRASQRTQAIEKLDGYRKLALTGTPQDKNPGDLWAILRWLYPERFTSYWAFFDRHTEVEIDLWGKKKILGVKDAQAFAAQLTPYVLRRSKREVAKQLPEKIIQVIPIEMTKPQEALYKRIEEIAEITLDLDTGEELLVKNTLGRMLRLQQAASDPRLLGTSDLGGKLQWLLDYVNDNEDQTLLIFTRFSDTAHRIAGLLDIPVVTGKLNTLGSSPAPIIVGTIDAMSEGYNFGHIWNTVYIDTHWSSIKMEQSIDRTERDLDATLPRVIMYLQAQTYAGLPTIDKIVYDAVSKKLDTLAMVYSFLGITKR